MGELIFIDLRNSRGITQLVIESGNSNQEKANSIRNEFVIFAKGMVVERKNKNPELPSGEIEVVVKELEIISEAKTTPLMITEETDALEKKRLEYRYLDLRRENIKSNLIKRAKVNRIIRDHFDSLQFIEVETPIITKPTPGGAGELKVISKNHEGKSYALVQSPQIYKQLLMYGGLEGYYQIAKCFRDEKGRGDRQLEFTQLDIEKSFTSFEEIKSMIEPLIVKIVKELTNQSIEDNFNIISYDEAMNRFGSDKPDTRFSNELIDLTDTLINTPVNFIADGISNGKSVISVSFNEEVSSSFIKKLEEELKMQGASGLA
jgi:aspartyl-tRNA synthetase